MSSTPPPTAERIASVIASVRDCDADVWNQLVIQATGGPHPFLDHAFFLALEESGSATGQTGWQGQHILIHEGDELVGLMPIFAKSHSRGEYVFDHGWADAFERAGGQYYPKLQSSIPFTPATTPKLLVKNQSIEIQADLLQAAETLCDRLNFSSVHATFVTSPEEELAQSLGWLTRHDVQFHWHNDGFKTFDDFLATLASRKRKAIKRERRDALADGIEVKWLSGSDLNEAHWDAFFEFYADTGDRKWGTPYLTRQFFSQISATMADKIVLMLAYDGDEPIAGALNFRSNDVLYGRNWGCNRHVPFLHFELCYYQAIDYAIAHGLTYVEAGAQGEHKLARGYAPNITRSVHYIAHEGLRHAIADYLKNEKSSVDQHKDMLTRYTPFRRGPQV